MNIEQLIEKINADINTNSEGDITGAKLNEVLRDIVTTIMENTVQDVKVFISASHPTATFQWTFKTTSINNITMDGYNDLVFSGANKFPLNGMQISDGVRSTSYSSHGWGGTLTELQYGKWYWLRYNDAQAANSLVVIKKHND